MRLQLLAGCLLVTMFLAPYGYAQQRGQQQGKEQPAADSGYFKLSTAIGSAIAAP